jgi:hypothetical protein
MYILRPFYAVQHQLKGFVLSLQWILLRYQPLLKLHVIIVQS